VSAAYDFSISGAGEYTFRTSGCFHVVDAIGNIEPISADPGHHIAKIAVKLARPTEGKTVLEERAKFIGRESEITSAISITKRYVQITVWCYWYNSDEAHSSCAVAISKSMLAEPLGISPGSVTTPINGMAPSSHIFSTSTEMIFPASPMIAPAQMQMSLILYTQTSQSCNPVFTLRCADNIQIRFGTIHLCGKSPSLHPY